MAYPLPVPAPGLYAAPAQLSGPVEQAAMQAFQAAFRHAVEMFAAHMFAAGVQYGQYAAKEATKSALADGLRHGSPECGRAMRNLHALD